MVLIRILHFKFKYLIFFLLLLPYSIEKNYAENNFASPFVRLYIGLGQQRLKLYAQDLDGSPDYDHEFKSSKNLLFSLRGGLIMNHRSVFNIDDLQARIYGGFSIFQANLNRGSPIEHIIVSDSTRYELHTFIHGMAIHSKKYKIFFSPEIRADKFAFLFNGASRSFLEYKRVSDGSRVIRQLNRHYSGLPGSLCNIGLTMGKEWFLDTSWNLGIALLFHKDCFKPPTIDRDSIPPIRIQHPHLGEERAFRDEKIESIYMGIVFSLGYNY